MPNKSKHTLRKATNQRGKKLNKWKKHFLKKVKRESKTCVCNKEEKKTIIRSDTISNNT